MTNYKRSYQTWWDSLPLVDEDEEIVSILNNAKKCKRDANDKPLAIFDPSPYLTARDSESPLIFDSAILSQDSGYLFKSIGGPRSNCDLLRSETQSMSNPSQNSNDSTISTSPRLATPNEFTDSEWESPPPIISIPKRVNQNEKYKNEPNRKSRQRSSFQSAPSRKK